MPSTQLHSPNKSIAISVSIKPSRLLKIALAAMVLLSILVSSSIAFNLVGQLNTVMRSVLTVIGLVAAAKFCAELLKQRHTVALDIRGTGEIKLRATLPNVKDDIRAVIDASPAVVCSLAAGSVITPVILVLRLADNHGNINTLLIFTDSVTGDAFRRLSLACRWLVGHQKRQQPQPQE